MVTSLTNRTDISGPIRTIPRHWDDVIRLFCCASTQVTLVPIKRYSRCNRFGACDTLRVPRSQISGTRYLLARNFTLGSVPSPFFFLKNRVTISDVIISLPLLIMFFLACVLRALLSQNLFRVTLPSKVCPSSLSIPSSVNAEVASASVINVSRFTVLKKLGGYYDGFSQGVNLQGQVSFWSGSFAAQTACGPFCILA